MAEWFFKKITGQDLMDKAWDLVVAEENANMIINALRPELEEISDDHEPIVIRAEGGGTSGLALWQSKRFIEEARTIKGSYRFFNVVGVGRIIDGFVSSNSNNFSLELIVDGIRWYSDTYSKLGEITEADSHLAIYDDSGTGEYFIKVSDINYLQGVEIILGGSNITFNNLRVNYEELVQ